MERIQSIANELADAITSSPSYQEYTKRRISIEENPSLFSKIQDFKRTQMSFQSQLSQNVQPAFDEEKHASTLYTELMLNEDAKDFLTSEKELLDMLCSVYEIIGNRCEINTFM